MPAIAFLLIVVVHSTVKFDKRIEKLEKQHKVVVTETK